MRSFLMKLTSYRFLIINSPIDTQTTYKKKQVKKH
jgi:hypothetical protein